VKTVKNIFGANARPRLQTQAKSTSPEMNRRNGVERQGIVFITVQKDKLKFSAAVRTCSVTG